MPDASRYDAAVLRLEYDRVQATAESIAEVRTEVLNELRQFPTFGAGVFTLFLVFRPEQASRTVSLLYAAGALPFLFMVIATVYVFRDIDPVGNDPGSTLEEGLSEAQWLLNHTLWTRTAIANLGVRSWRRVRKLRSGLLLLLLVEVIYLTAVSLWATL